MILKYQMNIFNSLLFLWIVSIPFKNAVFQISTFLLVVYFISYVFYYKDYLNIKKIVSKYKDLFLFLILIILSMMISNIINFSNLESWKLTFYYIYRYGFILFLLFYFYSKNFYSKRKLYIFILFSLSLQAIDGGYQSITGTDIFNQNIGNIYQGLTGGTSNRNIFSFFMGLGVLLTVMYTKYDKKGILFILSLLFIFCTLFSYSRAIWVSLFFSLLIFVVLNFREFKKKNYIYFSIYLFLIVIVFLNSEGLVGRFNLLLEGYSSNRTDIWMHGLSLIKENWVFGYGVDNFELYKYKVFTSMHNHTLEILFDLGVVGLISFSILLFSILKELKKYNSSVLFCFLMYFLIDGNFGESIISSKTFLSSITLLVFFIYIKRIEKDKI